MTAPRTDAHPAYSGRARDPIDTGWRYVAGSNPSESVAERREGRVNSAAMLTQGEVISTDREILAGEPVFAGTRVPLRNLFDYLEAGDSLEIFLDAFPDVTRDQAVAALEIAREAVTSSATSR